MDIPTSVAPRIEKAIENGATQLIVASATDNGRLYTEIEDNPTRLSRMQNVIESTNRLTLESVYHLDHIDPDNL